MNNSVGMIRNLLENLMKQTIPFQKQVLMSVSG
jgi:hypothetical protein